MEVTWDDLEKAKLRFPGCPLNVIIRYAPGAPDYYNKVTIDVLSKPNTVVTACGRTFQEALDRIEGFTYLGE